MRLEIKSIFKNKVTWIFILLLLLIGLKTVIEMEVYQAHRNENRVRESEWQLAILKDDNERTHANVDQMELTEEEKDARKNYFAYSDWGIAEQVKLIECLKQGEDPAEYETITSLINIFAAMTLNSDEEKGRPIATEVYKEQISKYQEKLGLEKLPFDMEKLKKWRGFNTQSESVKNVLYESSQPEINYMFYLLDHSVKPLRVDTPSPLSFLSYQLSLEQLPTVLIGSLLILFAAYITIEGRNNGSRQLLELFPGDRNSVVWHYVKSVLVCSYLILVIAFGIPMIMLGIGHGLSDMSIPIFVDPEGFTSYTPYTHEPIGWSFQGLSKVYGEILVEGSNSFISPALVIWPFWRFMLPALAVSALKIIFLTLLGVAIGLFVKKRWMAVIVSAAVAAVYAASQYVPAGLKWNPFSVRSGWDVTLGWTHMTWLNAVVLLIISILLLTGLSVLLRRKQDF